MSRPIRLGRRFSNCFWPSARHGWPSQNPRTRGSPLSVKPVSGRSGITCSATVGRFTRSACCANNPDGWFTRSWPAEIESILASVIGFLRANHGPGSAWWEWGDVRPLLLRHTILGRVRGLKSIFNRGPYPIGGDANTVSQAGCRPSSPTSPTHNFANMRTVFDTADWSNCRFVLAGGQSGNPLSDHYDDQLQLWIRGEAIAIPWTGDEVVQSATAALRLTPEKSAS